MDRDGLFDNEDDEEEEKLDETEVIHQSTLSQNNLVSTTASTTRAAPIEIVTTTSSSPPPAVDGVMNDSFMSGNSSASEIKPLALSRGIDPGNNSVRYVSCGHDHTICVTYLGIVYAWGKNDFGQLGLRQHAIAGAKTIMITASIGVNGNTNNSADDDGNLNSKAKAIDVTNSIASSGGSSDVGLFRERKDTLRNDRKQSYHPVHVEGIKNIISIACGAHYSICCDTKGKVYSWGKNDSNQLGYPGYRCNNNGYQDVPMVVDYLSSQDIIRVGAATTHSGALTSSGSLYTFGSFTYGKLGHGIDANRDGLPKQVIDITESIVDFSLGVNHSCAVTESGKLYSWGSGWNGKLGNGANENKYSPLQVIYIADKKISKVSCGEHHTLALTADGKVLSWGKGGPWLGHGTPEDKLIPQEIKLSLPGSVATPHSKGLEDTKISDICAGNEHSFLVTEKFGHVLSFGRDRYGKLGFEDIKDSQFDVSIPTEVNPKTLSLLEDPKLLDNKTISQPEDIRCVRSMLNHCIALTQNSLVYVWGNSESGRLGIGSLKAQGEFMGFESDEFDDGEFDENGDDNNDYNNNNVNSNMSGPNESSVAISPTLLSVFVSNIARAQSSGSTTNPPSVRTGRDKIGFETRVRRGSMGAGQGSSPSPSLKVTGDSSSPVVIGQVLSMPWNEPLFMSKYTNEQLTVYKLQQFLLSKRIQSRDDFLRNKLDEVFKQEKNIYLELSKLYMLWQEVRQIEQAINLILDSTFRKLQFPPARHDLIRFRKQQYKKQLQKEKVQQGLFKKIVKSLFCCSESYSSVMAQSAAWNTNESSFPLFSEEIVLKLPGYGEVVSYLLLNPTYMANIFDLIIVDEVTACGIISSVLSRDVKRIRESENDNSSILKLAVKMKDLYFSLVRDMYKLNDPHCEHLYLKLCGMIFSEEVSRYIIKNRNATLKQFMFVNDSGYSKTMFARLCQHYFSKSAQIQSWADRIVQEIFASDDLVISGNVTLSVVNADFEVDPYYVAQKQDSSSNKSSSSSSSGNNRQRNLNNEEEYEKSLLIYSTDQRVSAEVNRNVQKIAIIISRLLTNIIHAATVSSISSSNSSTNAQTSGNSSIGQRTPATTNLSPSPMLNTPATGGASSLATGAAATAHAFSIPDGIRMLCSMMFIEIERQMNIETDCGASLLDIHAAISRFLIVEVFIPSLRRRYASVPIITSSGTIAAPSAAKSTEFQTLSRVLTDVFSLSTDFSARWEAPWSLLVSKNKDRIVNVVRTIIFHQYYQQYQQNRSQVSSGAQPLGSFSKVNNDFTYASELNSMLFADLILEYTQVSGNELLLPFTNRSLQFLRFALFLSSKSRDDAIIQGGTEGNAFQSQQQICLSIATWAKDPINYIVATRFFDSEESESIAAQAFCNNLDSFDDENAVNVKVDLRRFQFDMEKVNRAPPISSLIKIDARSRVPVPSIFAPNSAAQYFIVDKPKPLDPICKSLYDALTSEDSMPLLSVSQDERFEVTVMNKLNEISNSNDPSMKQKQQILLNVNQLAQKPSLLNQVISDIVSYTIAVNEHTNQLAIRSSIFSNILTRLKDSSIFFGNQKAELLKYQSLLYEGLGEEQNRELASRQLSQNRATLVKLAPPNIVAYAHGFRSPTIQTDGFLEIEEMRPLSKMIQRLVVVDPFDASERPFGFDRVASFDASASKISLDPKKTYYISFKSNGRGVFTIQVFDGAKKDSKPILNPAITANTVELGLKQSEGTHGHIWKPEGSPIAFYVSELLLLLESLTMKATFSGSG